MSDTTGSASVSKQDPSTTANLPPGQAPTEEAAAQVTQGEIQVLEGTGKLFPEDQAEHNLESLRLLGRFLLGISLSGSGSFVEMLRDVQRDLQAEPGALALDSNEEDESLHDLLRYLTIGLLVQGTEGVFGLIGSGFRLSLDVTGRLISGVDQATDNRLARPLRRAVVSRLQRLEHDADLAIDKGRVEEKNAKLLTGETIDKLMDQAIDAVAQSPELTDMIISIVSQQGKGMAGVAGDNARSLSVIADSATERVIRRLFKRKPRQDLSPSPMRGMSQSTYSAEELVKGVIEREQ